MKKYTLICLFLPGLLIFFSCTEYTPKPRGYFRIELPLPQYAELPLSDLPYSFLISPLTTVELPPESDPAGWINISYPSLQAKIYCSYFPVNPSTLEVVLEESRTLMLRQSKGVRTISEQVFENREEHIYASLYLLEGETASPIQFTVTDSTARFFRGSLLYDTFNTDSLAPVTHYIKADVVELIQSFTWKQ